MLKQAYAQKFVTLLWTDSIVFKILMGCFLQSAVQNTKPHLKVMPSEVPVNTKQFSKLIFISAPSQNNGGNEIIS